MTFLKRLGEILAKGLAIAAGVGPLIAPYLGAKSGMVTEAVNDLTQISNIVIDAEAMMQTPGSGAAKLAASTPLVLQVLKTSQAFSGKKIDNEALAEEGAADIVTGLTKFMNAIHVSEAKTA